jgi:hypothetical protein
MSNPGETRYMKVCLLVQPGVQCGPSVVFPGYNIPMTTTLNIEFDATQEAYRTCVGTPYFPPVHRVVVGSQWIKMARRAARKPSLFLYFHTGTQNYVFADWIYKPGTGKGPGLLTELEAWEYNPDDPEAPAWTTEDVIARCQPAPGVAKELKKRLTMLKNVKQAEKMEDAIQRQDVAKWLKKRGDIVVAQQLSDGLIDYTGNRQGGENLKELKKQLISQWRRGR